MGAAYKLGLVSVEDYLAGELRSVVKHEYQNGFIYAMAGTTNNHGVIAGNVFGNLFQKLRGKRCRPYNSDTKVRIRSFNQTRFYYPDISVPRDSNPREDLYQDAPVIVVEVLSRSTRRTDTGEKKEAYVTIPSLSAYLLVEPDESVVTVFRRQDVEFVREVYEGHDAVIPLPEIEAELALSDIYEDVTFVAEPDEES